MTLRAKTFVFECDFCGQIAVVTSPQAMESFARRWIVNSRGEHICPQCQVPKSTVLPPFPAADRAIEAVLKKYREGLCN